MTQSRLTLALSGAEPLAAGATVLVLGPRGDADLSALPAGAVRAVQGFRPDHDALRARGFAVTAEPEGEGLAAGIVVMPRSRSQARAMVAEAAARVAIGAPIWIDGQKTDGIDAMQRDLRDRAEVQPALSKAHGKIFGFANPGPQAFAAWRAAEITPAPGFVTVPGVFSAEAVDRGSALLADALPSHLPRRVADLGAGWGWLSAQILARGGVATLDLIEADHAALSCARRNVSDPRAQFHWADALRFEPAAPCDLVVMNPPFHQGRAADPALGAGFIAAAARMLGPQGALIMVANRHLPYEAALAAAFREVVEIGGDGGFKILRASHPVRGGSGTGARAAAPPPRRRR